MKTRILAAALIAALSQTAFADGGAYWNNVQGSFDNMLNHEPYTGPTAVTVALGVKDPVELALHAPAVGGFEPASSTYFANVNDSFERNLNHVPYSGPTDAVARAEKDPVEQAIHAMLRGEPAPVQFAQGENGVRN